MQQPATNYNLRISYPDEHKRIIEFIGGEKRAFRHSHFAVLTCGVPERIVAAASLNIEQSQLQKIPAYLLRFKILSRHNQADWAQKLMDMALKLAKDKKYNVLNLELPSQSPDKAFYKKNGFIYLKTEQLWRLDLAVVSQRLERLKSKLKLPETYHLRSPEEEDLPQLKKLSLHYGFREEDHIFFSTTPQQPFAGYSQPHCSVITHKNAIIAALLVKSGPGTLGHVDIRMVAPEYLKESSRLNWTLLERTVRLSLESGYLHTTLTVNLERDQETLNLCQRMRGTHLKGLELWNQTLSAPPTED